MYSIPIKVVMKDFAIYKVCENVLTNSARRRFPRERVYILCSLNTISFLIRIIRLSTDRPRGVDTLAHADAPTAVNFHAGSRETKHSVGRESDHSHVDAHVDAGAHDRRDATRKVKHGQNEHAHARRHSGTRARLGRRRVRR